MAKQVVGQAKFQVPGGSATPAPPVGTSLGKFGINLGQFVSQFNERTRGVQRNTHPGRGHGLFRSNLRVRHQEPTSGRIAQAGCRYRQRLWRAEQEEGWQGHQGADRRHLQQEDGRLKCTRSRTRHPHDRRYCPQHGLGGRRLNHG